MSVSLMRSWSPVSFHPKQLIRGITTASAIQRGIGRFQANAHRGNSNGSPAFSRNSQRQRDVSPGHSFNKKDAKQRLPLRRTSDTSTPYQQSEKPSAEPRNKEARSQHSQLSQDRRFRSGTRTTDDGISKGSASAGRRRASPSRYDMPISIPHTTAASEFLYGRSAVEAALRARRRKLYKLYVFNPDTNPAGSFPTREPLVKLAHAAGVEVEMLRSEQLLQKISGGRPTNGLALEASPLPFLKCTSLETADLRSSAFGITRSAQSQEEREISGNQSVVQYDARRNRYPFLLFLDGILDPGNLGAILRSAFFLGADAVVLSTHGSPLTAAALKAASGAAETLPLLLTRATGPFIRTSQSHGWKFYAATPSPQRRESTLKPTYSLESLRDPLSKHPSVVVLGGEGAGLWQDVKDKADYFISIHGPRSGQDGVDSLNVSVSAALLTQAFMRTLPTRSQGNRLWEQAT